MCGTLTPLNPANRELFEQLADAIVGGLGKVARGGTLAPEGSEPLDEQALRDIRDSVMLRDEDALVPPSRLELSQRAIRAQEADRAARLSNPTGAFNRVGGRLVEGVRRVTGSGGGG